MRTIRVVATMWLQCSHVVVMWQVSLLDQEISVNDIGCARCGQGRGAVCDVRWTTVPSRPVRADGSTTNTGNPRP